MKVRVDSLLIFLFLSLLSFVLFDCVSVQSYIFLLAVVFCRRSFVTRSFFFACLSVCFYVVFLSICLFLFCQSSLPSFVLLFLYFRDCFVVLSFVDLLLASCVRLLNN